MRPQAQAQPGRLAQQVLDEGALEVEQPGRPGGRGGVGLDAGDEQAVRPEHVPDPEGLAAAVAVVELDPALVDDPHPARGLAGLEQALARREVAPAQAAAELGEGVELEGAKQGLEALAEEAEVARGDAAHERDELGPRGVVGFVEGVMLELEEHHRGDRDGPSAARARVAAELPEGAEQAQLADAAPGVHAAQPDRSARALTLVDDVEAAAEHEHQRARGGALVEQGLAGVDLPHPAAGAQLVHERVGDPAEVGELAQRGGVDHGEGLEGGSRGALVELVSCGRVGLEVWRVGVDRRRPGSAVVAQRDPRRLVQVAVAEQQVVVEQGVDALEADRAADVPGLPAALLGEHAPRRPGADALGREAREVGPVDGLEALERAVAHGAQVPVEAGVEVLGRAGVPVPGVLGDDQLVAPDELAALGVQAVGARAQPVADPVHVRAQAPREVDDRRVAEGPLGAADQGHAKARAHGHRGQLALRGRGRVDDVGEAGVGDGAEGRVGVDRVAEAVAADEAQAVRALDGALEPDQARAQAHLDVRLPRELGPQVRVAGLEQLGEGALLVDEGLDDLPQKARRVPDQAVVGGDALEGAVALGGLADGEQRDEGAQVVGREQVLEAAGEGGQPAGVGLIGELVAQLPEDRAVQPVVADHRGEQAGPPEGGRGERLLGAQSGGDPLVDPAKLAVAEVLEDHALARVDVDPAPDLEAVGELDQLLVDRREVAGPELVDHVRGAERAGLAADAIAGLEHADVSVASRPQQRRHVDAGWPRADDGDAAVSIELAR
ncbi:hypothetical protein PPSIR1_05813 [Plesiocystis pacifica SIR-1]|uniref:Uncharacterized protein n=1 Tax=Plesiocystis pacifica SIR-1 TaxID=391625 RepID=A6FXD5_9BACT|nr:hypothetical protein [Plesiocystis pacifica]EDM81959.1 hypothetical protein PPSIR1_05813 [Plesiocystis pacifica SIR-1]